MILGTKLKELRENKQLTQEELGKIINQKKANISKYENDKLQPSLETINLIAKFFGVTTDYLLGHTNDPKTPQSLKDKVFDPTYKPTEVDLEELLKSSNVKFQGNTLATEDKEKLLRIAELLWEERRKTELKRQK